MSAPSTLGTPTPLTKPVITTPLSLRRLQQLHSEAAAGLSLKPAPLPGPFLTPLDKSRLAVNLVLAILIAVLLPRLSSLPNLLPERPRQVLISLSLLLLGLNVVSVLVAACWRWLRGRWGQPKGRPLEMATTTPSRPLVKDATPSTLSSLRSDSIIMLPPSTPAEDDAPSSSTSLKVSGSVSPASWQQLLRDQLTSSPSTRRGVKSEKPEALAASVSLAQEKTSSSPPVPLPPRTPSLLASPLVKRASSPLSTPTTMTPLLAPTSAGLMIPPSPLQGGNTAALTKQVKTEAANLLPLPAPDQVERMAQWLVRMVLRPLRREIEQVGEAFVACGWGHLAPLADSGALLPAAPQQPAMPDRITLQPPPLIGQSTLNQAVPQTLAQLAATRGSDALVQRRLRLEALLTAPSGCPQVLTKADCYRLLGEMLADGVALPRPEHGWMALHWLCCHLDEHLAAEGRPSASPFTSLHLVREGSISPHLRLVMTSPLIFGLALPHSTQILSVPQVHSPCTNLLEAMVMLVAQVARQYRGYLGMGNLGTPRINLLSIL